MTALVLGQLVGTGMRSHVFALDDHRVVKVPRDGTPDTWMRREAEYTAAVHALGLPVPAMLELAVHEGRTVVVYQRVLGPSMWAAVIDRPANASLLGQTLAELHLALLHKAAPVSLPRQRDRLACKIRTVREIVGPEIEAQFERRADSRAPMRLCHGDLHPGNVIMSPDGPIVLDWFDASRGEVLADVARSSILMGAGTRMNAPLLHLVPIDRGSLRLLHDAYLDTMKSRVPSFDDLAFAEWLRIGAAARVAEGVGGSELLSLARPPEG